jgi:hypothetical protein
MWLSKENKKRRKKNMTSGTYASGRGVKCLFLLELTPLSLYTDGSAR